MVIVVPMDEPIKPIMYVLASLVPRPIPAELFSLLHTDKQAMLKMLKSWDGPGYEASLVTSFCYIIIFIGKQRPSL